jgi:hypothetical protein
MDDDRTDTVTTNDPANVTPRRSRWRWRVFLVVVFLGGMVAAVLASGLPQRRLIPQTVQRALGAEVSMAVRSTWSRVELGDILLREPNAPDLPPLLRAESLSMPWTFSGPRHVPSLLVTGLEINLNGMDPQRTNYGWVNRFMAQPSSGWDLLPYTPVNVTVAPIRMTAELPGASLSVEGAGAGGLVLTAMMESGKRYKMGLVGDDAELRWTLPGVAPQTFSKNGVRLQVEADETAYAAVLNLRLPKEDRIQGTIRVTREGQNAVAELVVKDSALRQPVWSELAAAFLPVPVRFTAVECPDLRAKLHRSPGGWGMDRVDLKTRATGLTVGPIAAPWFFGDVQLATAAPPKDAQFAATAVIDELPPMQFRWGAQKDGWKIGARLDQWTWKQLAALLPAKARAMMTRYAPFEQVSIASELGPTPDGWGFSGDARLQPAKGAGDPVTVQTRGTWANGALSAETKASMGEGTALELKGLRYDRATGKTAVAVSGPVDLVPLAKLAGFPEVWGAARVEGRFLLDALGNIQAAPLRTTFETLGYGDFGIPYGVELSLSAPVRQDKAGLATGPVEATLGADTTFKAAKVAWGADGILASDLALETGLTPLVSKGWLAAAEGHASARCASMSWPIPGPQDTIEYDATFARLDLPAGWAAIKGFTAKGQLNWDKAPAGSGTVAADEAMVAGMTLHGIGAALRVDGTDVVLENITFGLFGGVVSGEARVTPLDSILPASFSAAVEKVDLDVFTKEYKPPSTRLTGIVSGRVSASLDLNGLRALDVDLKSDGGVSMNRDMVEQLLASEYLSGMSGGKQVSQMLRDVVGDAEQISFTGATVRLGLDTGRITGTARLESEKLNLTLDIKADPGALLEALRARSANAAVEKTAQ